MVLNKSLIRFVVLGILLALLAGCSFSPAAAPTATAVPPTPPPPPATPTAVPTLPPTPEPSPTLPPTPEPSPTLPLTPEPAAVAAEPTPAAAAAPAEALADFAVWCMPAKKGIKNPGSQPETMPQGAWVGTVVNKVMRVQVPASFCTFVYTFDQPLPAGASLQFFNNKQQKPWLTTPLIPSSTNPNVGYYVITNPGFVVPPVWEITYRLAVTDGTSELRSNTVTLFKSLPAPCWDGALPDPVTMECKCIDGDWNVDKPETIPTLPN